MSSRLVVLVGTALAGAVGLLLTAVPAAAQQSLPPGVTDFPAAGSPEQVVQAPIQDLLFPSANAEGTVVDEGDGGFRVATDVLFEFDRSDLLPAGREEITSLASQQRISEPTSGGAVTSVIEVIGHTDDVGDDDYNLRLSQARAESVRAVLQELVPSGVQVRATGRGEVEPIADNGTDQGRAANRRVEIAVGG